MWKSTYFRPRHIVCPFYTAQPVRMIFLKKLAKNTLLKMQFMPIKFGIGFKMLYLCIVEKGDKIYALGSEKIFLVHEEIFPKANGKKEVPVGREN